MPSFVNKPVVNKSQNFNGNEKQQARKNIGAASEEELISHVSDTSNPHEVTAEQVGAYTKDHVDEKIKAVTDLIPTAATPANQLADKAYVDFGVEQMAAKYLSATADGQPFSSYAQFQQGVFYYGGEVTEPTKNDYALVNGDETHDNAVTRYVFTTEWNFQYVVNNSPLNAEQLAALNSGINATKVGNYDSHIADTTKHITEAERTKWNAAVQPSQLATVATTGSYSDLTDKPTIPPAITVDSAMSSTSTNPVQNKVVNDALSTRINTKQLSVSVPGKSTKYVLMSVDSSLHTYLVFFNGTLGVAHQEWLFRCYGIGGTARTSVNIIGATSGNNNNWYVAGSSGRFFYIKFYNDTTGNQDYSFKVASLDGSTLPLLELVDSVPDDYVELGVKGVYHSSKLTTPRSLGVNLARTTASTFDGSANQLEIPVKGKLPDSNIASASTWNGKQDALSFTTPAEITEILGGLE